MRARHTPAEDHDIIRSPEEVRTEETVLVYILDAMLHTVSSYNTCLSHGFRRQRRKPPRSLTLTLSVRGLGGLSRRGRARSPLLLCRRRGPGRRGVSSQQLPLDLCLERIRRIRRLRCGDLSRRRWRAARSFLQLGQFRLHRRDLLRCAVLSAQLPRSTSSPLRLLGRFQQ